MTLGIRQDANSGPLGDICVTLCLNPVLHPVGSFAFRVNVVTRHLFNSRRHEISIKMLEPHDVQLEHSHMSHMNLFTVYCCLKGGISQMIKFQSMLFHRTDVRYLTYTLNSKL